MMAKTSNAIPSACAKLEIQPNCTGSWYNISGEAMSVSGTKITRATGSMAVFGDDEHVITAGKKDPITVTFSGVYTENAAEAFEYVRAVWETPGCDKPLCVRWSPDGGGVGDKQYKMVSPDAQLVGFQYPEVNAGDGGPIPFEFDVFGYIDTDTVAS